MERVSVVIPCYGQAHYLPEAIDSVLSQTYPHHEIIVVDDGSPDDTASVVGTYAGVKYIRQENQGLPGARNTGIRNAVGTYLVFLDADDRLTPTNFEIGLAAFRARPDAAMVFGNYRWFGAEGLWHTHYCEPLPDLYGTLLSFQLNIPVHAAMLKREVVLRLDGFRTDFREGCEDVEFFLRVAKNFPIYCHHHTIAEYRRHSGQMTTRWDRVFKSLMAVRRMQRRHVRKYPQYKASYLSSIEWTRRCYGEPLIWQTVADLRRGNWAVGLRGLYVLTRYYPQGLLKLVQQKVLRTVKAHQSV